jgi:hypothetical protein
VAGPELVASRDADHRGVQVIFGMVGDGIEAMSVRQGCWPMIAPTRRVGSGIWVWCPVTAHVEIGQWLDKVGAQPVERWLSVERCRRANDRIMH